MAYQVGSTCYGTATEAGQAQASSIGGTFAQVGQVPHSVAVASVDDGSITYVLTPVTGGQAITHVAPFNPQPCNMLGLADGLQVGWMIGAAWIGAFAVLAIKHALSGETGGNYGNA